MTTVTIGTLQVTGANGAALADAIRKAGTTHGLIIGGRVGSGKTTTATALVANRGFIVKLYQPEKVARLEDWRGWLLPDKWVLLDDLGRDAVRNEFGNRSDAVGRFIRELYDAWKAGEWTGRLYATTNLSGAELKEAYDESVVSRIAELCVPCKFDEPRRPRAGNSASAPVQGEAHAESSAPSQTETSREDAFWDRMIDLAKRDSAENGGIRNAALTFARNGDGSSDSIWRCAWRVAKNELGCWTAKDCALVGVAWTRGLGRPQPRYVARMGQKPFDLYNALAAIIEGRFRGADDDARWFAARTLAWSRKALGPEGERAAEVRVEWYESTEPVDWEGYLAEASALRDWQKAHAERENPNVAVDASKADFAAVAGGL